MCYLNVCCKITTLSLQQAYILKANRLYILLNRNDQQLLRLTIILSVLSALSFLIKQLKIFKQANVVMHSTKYLWKFII